MEMEILFLRKAIFSCVEKRPKEVPARPWKKRFYEMSITDNWSQTLM